MPLPLKPRYNFNLDRTVRPPYYEMSSAECYTEFYGISFMISGERLIYSPNFTTIISAGDIGFIPKNLYRRTTYISNAPYERILIKFNDSMVEELINSIGKKAFDQLFLEHIIHIPAAVQDKIMGIMREMEHEWNNYNEYSEILIKGLINKIFIICLRERILTGNSAINFDMKHTHLMNAIQYIKANLRNNPSLEETAAAINISVSYLSKIFINQLHTPYSTFVLNEKITFAQKLLVETRLSMTEIATESGFTSNAYFSDCFKRVVGISPLQFRKNK